MTSETLKYQVKFLSSLDDIQYYHQAVTEFFSNLKYDKFVHHIEISDSKTSLNEFNYCELQELAIVILCSGIKCNFDFVNFATHIHKMWCKESLKNEYLQWLIPDNNYISSPTLITTGSLRPNEIAFGTLPGMKDYVQCRQFRQLQLASKVISSILCTFNHLQREVTVYISNTHKSTCHLSGEMGYKLTFIYDSIIRILANVDSDLNAAELFLHLEHPPFIHINVPGELIEDDDDIRMRVTKTKEMEDSSRRFERIFQMGCSCNNTLLQSKLIGKNLVLKLIVEDKFQFRWNLEQISLRCAQKTEICFTSIKTNILKKENKLNLRYFPHYTHNNIKPFSELDKFNCDYAWNVVQSRSDVILHQMALENMKTGTYIKKLNKIIFHCLKLKVSAFIKSLYCIADMIDKGIVFQFLSLLQIKFSYFCSFVELNELPKGMSYVRRVLITPSRIIFLQPYEHFDNRIIRKFGVEFMMRVSVQDDNYSKLTYAVQYNSKKEEIMKNVVANVLLNGITIGIRKYEPLAASTSQLREHGMWMYAKDFENNTASSIRQWMGDFSSIKNVAKYMARMGQCLSSTEVGVQIHVEHDDEWYLKEITTHNKKYIFSDGIGIISNKLADEVRQVMLQNSRALSDISVHEQNVYKPVAFQIRYKGCKGMVVEYEVPGRKLGIRPSMKKFECTTSNQLEIVKTSAPTRLFLNKHLITILEQMGVAKEEFLKLELDMILHLLDSLMNEKVASDLLSQNLSPVFPFNNLQKAGFALTKDPFFRSLLLAYFKSFSEKLKVNMRIAIPEQYGRNMLGVLDETKKLKYGQVFVQYSISLTDPSAGLDILKEPVLVTKNPSLHPGDVRKLMAVDVPELHHIKDCIVFPSRGKRPHPDEMAGSDLDGDEMVVLWHKPLIFSRKSAVPMNYPVYKEECTNENIELSDMLKFFCEYIQNDNIGTFAHAHLVWADRLKDGIFSQKCMNIAKRYPYVLDFAKHGTTEYLQKSERPYHYPDFLQKGIRGNTYHSHKVLGSLFRTSRVLDACSSKINLHCESTSLYDSNLEYPGWEIYESSAEAHCSEYTAKVLEVLDRYCLNSEAEAFSGFIEVEAHRKWRQEKSNAIKVVNKYLCGIMGHYRNIFLSEVKKECKENLSKEEALERKYQRASAWYMVVYSKKTKRVLSFPWILSDVLSDIKRKKSEKRTLPHCDMSNFFNDINCDINQWCSTNAIEHDESKCLCNDLLEKITQEWISASGLNIGNSEKSASCSSCYERILHFYKLKSDMHCCSGPNKTLCSCDKFCSPAKVIVDFLRFYIMNVEISGKCSKDSCDGFLPKNLQELALQTYSYIAITWDISYLGVQFNSNNFTKHAIPSGVSEIMFEEEGDPIKIPVNPVLKDLIEMHAEDIRTYLKKVSGVKDITLTPEKNSMCLIVGCIGKNWQRWNLQEILLDTNFTENLKKNLHITN